ncbi:MAG: hypothetical protein K940chlam7_00657 [Chlamydiae bacterium]|nr:hypothetical protein [Chlamydiota bacterium]
MTTTVLPHGGASSGSTDPLSKIFEATDEWENSFTALFVTAGKVGLILMKQGRFQNSFYQNSSPFSSLRCKDSSQLYKVSDELFHFSDPWKTIGICKYPCSRYNRATKKTFANGSIFVVNKIAFKRLENTFIPSSELQDGFEYSFKGLTIRGHAHHIEGEISAVSELRAHFFEGLVPKIPQVFPEHQPKFDQVISEFKQHLERFQSVSLKKTMTLQGFTNEVERKLKELFITAEKISHLRLYEKNPDTDREIGVEKQKFKGANKALRDFIGNECFQPVVTQTEIDDLKTKLQALLKGIETQQSRFPDDQRAQERTLLQSSWGNKLQELDNVLVDGTISAAQGPVLRIYNRILLDSLEALKQGLWQVLSEGIKLTSNDGSLLLLRDKTYRSSLIAVLEDEWAFYGPLASVSNRRLAERTIQELKDLDEAKNRLETLPPRIKELNAFPSLETENLEQFNETLRRGVYRAFSYLCCPTDPDLKAAFAPRVDRVILLLLKRFALIDDRLLLQKELYIEETKKSFLEEEYGKKRKHIDLQLFTLMTSILFESVQQPDFSSKSPLIQKLTQWISSYLRVERRYGPLKIKLECKTPLKEISDHLDILIDQINAMEGLLESHRETYHSTSVTIHEKNACLQALGSEMEENVNALEKHLRSKDFDESWWRDLKRFVNLIAHQKDEINSLLDEVQTALKKVGFNKSDFESAFLPQKQWLMHSLKRLRALLPKKSLLSKDITAFEQIDTERASPKENRGLVAAKRSMSTIRDNLSHLKKATDYDLHVRDLAIRKLEEAEKTFIPDPMQEFYIRCEGIKKTTSNMPKEDLLDVKKAIETQLQKISTKMEGAFSLKPNVPEQLSLLENWEREEVDKRDACLDILNGLRQSLIAFSKKTTDPKKKETAQMIADDLLVPLKQLESQHAHGLLTGISQSIVLSHFDRKRERFLQNTQYFNLFLMKREWLCEEGTVTPFFFWNGKPINEDPFFKRNATHIRL